MPEHSRFAAAAAHPADWRGPAPSRPVGPAQLSASAASHMRRPALRRSAKARQLTKFEVGLGTGSMTGDMGRRSLSSCAFPHVFSSGRDARLDSSKPHSPEFRNVLSLQELVLLCPSRFPR